uniref:FCH and mu domain containing endocytic adaptor 1 n=1 Tax=Sphenodon punctatus TaxID=8508 RepID=A0A8D0GSC9_SPHPU
MVFLFLSMGPPMGPPLSPATGPISPLHPCLLLPRAVVEETYAKSMGKLSKMAANSTQLGTFAPLWEVFRISSDKLALCHQELVRKLQELIREIGRYGEEQLRAHKKSKEEVSGTLEAVQALQTVAQLLPKAKENYHGKCQELERLRREGASQKEVDKAELKSKKAAEALRCAIVKYNVARDEFEHRMLESAMRFQELEESHLRSMKGLIGSYAHSVEDTHVQIGQVGVPTGGEGEPGGWAWGEVVGMGGAEWGRRGMFGPPDVDEEGFTVRPDTNPKNILPGSRCCSSSDSDYDENDEPRKFYVHIKPVQPRDNAVASVEQLKATVGSLILPPGPGVRAWYSRGRARERWGSGRAGGSRGPRPYILASSPSPFSSSSPENVEDSGLDSPSHAATGPSPDSRPWTPRPGTPQSPLSKRAPPREAPSPDPFFPEGRASTPHPWAPGSERPPQARERDACPSSNSASSSSSSPAPPSSGDSSSPSPWTLQFLPPPGVSRGPSPVVLGSHDALPVATAFTEYVHAYFKGCDPDSCLVKVTGELTMSFPAGILRVFSSCPAPPVLSFRLLHAAPIDQFLPNAELLYSDPSQSDPSAKDFWLNMTALTGHLQNQAEQTPTASYYNVPLLKYQVRRGGGSWGSGAGTGGVLGGRKPECPSPLPGWGDFLYPELHFVSLCRNLEEKRLLWRLLDVPGCGRLSASWDPLHGPSKPSPVAAQFTSEGSTLSGVEVELVGSGYRMSLVKKRFATGNADLQACCWRWPCQLCRNWGLWGERLPY